MNDHTERLDAIRCGNTIHSDYVTDHRCTRERGHNGDCAFGADLAAAREALRQIADDTTQRSPRRIARDALKEDAP